jgi:hypothetical protein
MLVRGIGPALASFGVPGALASPQLQLIDGTGKILATNTAWGGGASLAATFTQVGAFALATNSADTAATATLAPGNYSIVVSGTGSASGTALAEIYSTAVNPLLSMLRVINLSTRGQVSTGQPLIVGFVITGGATKQVLVRGVGPALASFGVSGALADPQLTLYDNAGKLVALNDNWGTPATVTGGLLPAPSVEIAAAAVKAGAFALASGSADSAVLVTLAPGAYTAQVAGAGVATSGTALVEIYEVP